MSVASTYNKGNKFGFQFPEKVSYTTLSEFADFQGEEAAAVRCLTINDKSKYGPQPIAWLDKGIALNMPRHTLDMVKEMIDDPAVIEAVKAGKLGIKARPYIGKDGKNYLGTEWVDL